MYSVSQDLITEICVLANNPARFQSPLLVAIAGPPASGKSTLAENLVTSLNRELNAEASVVLPMDGFHLDNVLLDCMDARARKGAPHTFDIDGFTVMLQRVSTSKNDVIVPVFDAPPTIRYLSPVIVPVTVA